MANPITITEKIIALLKQAGINYSKTAGKIDPNKISQLITKTQKTATKPKLIDALNKDKATYQQALDIFENDAKYLSQMNEMEQVNFVNNLEDYFKVGGKIKYRPSNVVTPEGTPVVGKKLEKLSERKGIKEKPDDTSLRGAMEGLMTLVDEMKGISPKMRNQMDRDELVAFIRKMRGRDFTNQEIKLVRDYMDEWGIGLAKEKAAPAMVHAKKLGAKDKEEFKFVEEYLDNIQTTSPEKFREMYGNVKNVNMKLSEIFDTKLEKHFKKKYKWDNTKRDGGLDDATFEKYEDELYEAQKEFSDFHRIYDTHGPLNIWGQRKSTSWVNNPKEYLDEASEKLKSITGEGLNTNFWKNYTDEVLTKYPKPEKFQYGGIAGMLGEPTFQDEEHRVPYKDAKLVNPGNAEVGDPTPGWGLSDLVRRYFLYQKVLPGVGEETIKYLGEKFLNDLNAQGYSPKDFKAYVDEQFPAKASGGRVPYNSGKKVKKKIMKGSPLDWWELIGDELDSDEWEDILKSVGALSYQTGGRVPFKGGGKGKVLEGLAKLFDEFFPGTTKVGQTSKPMAPKTLDKRAIAEFLEREKVAKAISEGPLPGERAGVNVPDMPAGFKLSREKLKQNFPELGSDEIDEIMTLDRELQGTVITMLKNRRLDPDLYDKLLLKYGDTLKFQGEFDRAIRRRKNATGGRVSLSNGGLAGMLGE